LASVCIMDAKVACTIAWERIFSCIILKCVN